jgi:DNA-binding response OmpR family regulator
VIIIHKVLLVDDEKRMLDLIALYLKPHNYLCEKALGAREALSYLEKEEVDIVLLDVMMPEIDGWVLCQKIRQFSDVPIIMLTAREEQEDIVKGLNLGADDYITKPFNEEELLARIQAILRRRSAMKKIEINGLSWNEERFELTFHKEAIKLTPKEFLMIGYLMKNANRVFKREHFIELLWGVDSETEGRTIDSHIRNVREKIRKAGFPIDEHLLTVWGIGYKWRN